jgi:hypothetical protein
VGEDSPAATLQMSSDTAEPAIAQRPSEHAYQAGVVAVRTHAEAGGRTAAVGMHVDGERVTALRDVWRALWSSRLLVWIAGSGAVATLGFGPVRHAFDPPGVTRGFGWLGDVLAAPAARWDAAWYLVIAHYGYRPELGAFTASRAAFFPLYPLGVRALSDAGLAPVIAGVALSIAALMAALYGLHRLTTLEVARLRRRAIGVGFPGSGVGGERLAKLDGGEVARLAVLLTAFAPMAFYFSAIYSESLYVALSVGLFVCARRGRWAGAALLGALASATRSTGVVLLVPLLLLYLYGPREDRVPERLPAPAQARLAALLAGVRPRYRLRRDALWLGLVPLGLGLYMAHLALAGGDPLAPFHAEAVWKRHFAGPYGGIWDGAKAAFAGLRQLLSLQRHHLYYPVAGGSPFIDAGHNLLLFAFLLLAIAALVGVMRLLPLAYGAYVLAALALPLSYPVAAQPLMSLPRFLLVLFPLNMWLAVTLALRPRALARAILVLSALAMAFFAGEFSTWHWVA